MLNLLTEQLIRLHQSGGALAAASLPEVYAALMADEVDAFVALRPHQRHAWHAFLVQLGALAMHRADVGEPPDSADGWATLLRGLTPDHTDDEPWHLVLDDITKPAFMQPPARSKEREKDYKSTVGTPDGLDMLVTSKNHDLKSSVAVQANADDWIFALITLQTMEGYGGRYNYGISRMPSGYGNRPAFSLTPSAQHGAHVKHDLMVLVSHRQTLLDEYPMTDSGIGLLWTIPWDGIKAEMKLVAELDPFYLEVCRRVRLRQTASNIFATRANSNDKRVVDVKGLTGDPWAPVSNKTNPKGTPPAFLTQRRFSYERVVDGLFSPDWKQPLLLSRSVQAVSDSGVDIQLVARGMVRGEGGTAGYHERIVPLRHKTIKVFGRPGGRQKLQDIARERIAQISTVQRILRYAVSVLAADGRTENFSEGHRARASFWANRLDEMVDTRFFDDLQDEFDADKETRSQIRNHWLRGVVDDARQILRNAAASLPCHVVHRFKSRANAERIFDAGLRAKNGLPFLFPSQNLEGK